MTKKPLVIGLVAVDGNGKTTLARHLQDSFSTYQGTSVMPWRTRTAVLDSIKGPLVNAACALKGLPAPVTATEYHKLKEDVPELRAIMTEVGYAVDKALGGDYLMRYWLNVCHQEVPPPRLQCEVIILDDVRTPEQVETLQQAGGVCIYIPPRRGLAVADTPLHHRIITESSRKCTFWIRPDSIAVEVDQIHHGLRNNLGWP